MQQILNSANFPFRSSTQLVRHYSNLQNFCLTISILLLQLEHWLADVVFSPSSTPTAAFQHSRHFWGKDFPQTLPVAARRVWGQDYIFIGSQICMSRAQPFMISAGGHGWLGTGLLYLNSDLLQLTQTLGN